jgi:succinate dehydrogenase / fumarate reductase cytochrome b subunit
MSYYRAPPLPRGFIWRRVHSLTGIWLVIYLIQHLLTNSQAALLVGDDGSGFVKAVNAIQELPYLPAIEIALVALPFIIHGLWGIKYAFTAQPNSFVTEDSQVSLPQYGRNRAYTWQRITSWILLFAVAAHVVHMRFIEYPAFAQLGTERFYINRLQLDNGLYPLSQRLGFELYDEEQIEEVKKDIAAKPLIEQQDNASPQALIEAQKSRESYAWLAALEKFPLYQGHVIAVSKTFGLATLLMVRDSFKDPLICLLYSIFVIASTFHAFNGLWTAMIRWGITLTAAAQRLMRKLTFGLMALVTFLGLVAIWGTYWFNLKS